MPIRIALVVLALLGWLIPGRAGAAPAPFCADALVLLSYREASSRVVHPEVAEVLRPEFEKVVIARDPRVLRLSVSGARGMIWSDAAGRQQRWTNPVVQIRVWGRGTNATHAVQVANAIAAEFCTRYRRTNEITARVLEPATRGRPVTARYDVIEPALERELRR